MNKALCVMLIGLAMAAFSSAAMAQGVSKPEPTAAPTVSAEQGVTAGKGWAIFGSALGAGLAVVGGAIGIGRIGGSMVEAIARQPEAGGAMFVPMIITAVMIEGGMLFAIVISLLGVLAKN